MNRYLKLLNWEINRFAKLYAVLWLLTLLLQLTGVLIYTLNFMNRAKEEMYRSSLTLSEYAARYRPTISFEDFMNNSSWFTAPIALCAAALLLYVFMIWYREWFGRNTFAYRLLMLPTARMNVYLVKLSAIILFVLGLIAFQLLVLPILLATFNAVVPSELRSAASFFEMFVRHRPLRLLYPPYLIQFVLHYGAGVMGVVVVFTSILLERSFRLKGLVAGVLYAIAALILFVSPMIITENWMPNYFYPSEQVVMEIIAGLVVTAFSLWFSSYLLRKKVTV